MSILDSTPTEKLHPLTSQSCLTVFSFSSWTFTWLLKVSLWELSINLAFSEKKISNGTLNRKCQWPLIIPIITARIRRMEEGTVFSLSVHTSMGGGPRSRSRLGGVPGQGGGVPGPGQGGEGSQVQVGGGSQVQVKLGGVPGPGQGGGGPRSRSEGYPVLVWGGYLVSGPGGYPVLVKGKIFDTRFGWNHVQTRGKIFCQGTPPPPLVKGKIIDTRFCLTHVQTGKKIFCWGTPPLPVKGKNFDTRFSLIHVQTGKKILCQGIPPLLPSKGKNFWHQIWLDTCSDWGKKILSRDPPPFPGNSKDLLWPPSRRYASCVHAGGLSCYICVTYITSWKVHLFHEASIKYTWDLI